MQLGFVSAILPELSFEEVLVCAAEIGYDCVEVMCWPKGKAERRYAGVTHIEVDDLTPAIAGQISNLAESHGITISALGYYPNPLVEDHEEGQVYIDHIKKVIDAAGLIGVGQMNTFVGRNPTQTVEDNWPRFFEVWSDTARYAESKEVRIGIENCPMLFTNDEWPGGKNLATSPAIWQRMFAEVRSNSFGLNYDPSHMVWQHMDYLQPLADFADKLFHIHAKDVRIDKGKLNEVGIMAPPNQWHTPKLPGQGQVNWNDFFTKLVGAGYDGPVCVEVEDRAFEGSLEKRKAALVQSHNYLRQFIPKNS